MSQGLKVKFIFPAFSTEVHNQIAPTIVFVGQNKYCIAAKCRLVSGKPNN